MSRKAQSEVHIVEGALVGERWDTWPLKRNLLNLGSHNLSALDFAIGICEALF